MGSPLFQGCNGKCPWGILHKTITNYVIGVQMLELNPKLGLVPPQVLLADTVTCLLSTLPMLTYKASCFSLKTRIQRQHFH